MCFYLAWYNCKSSAVVLYTASSTQGVSTEPEEGILQNGTSSQCLLYHLYRCANIMYKSSWQRVCFLQNHVYKIEYLILKG